MKEDDMVDLEQFREAVEALRFAGQSLASQGYDRIGPEGQRMAAEKIAKADRLLSIIDSAGKVEVPRNRAEAASLARRILAQLGVIDAHIDAAIARCEAALAQQPAAVPDEAARLLAICQNAHDRLLRGDDDSELLAILEQAWSARKALESP